jgi:hypothetical protein
MSSLDLSGAANGILVVFTVSSESSEFFITQNEYLRAMEHELQDLHTSVIFVPVSMRESWHADMETLILKSGQAKKPQIAENMLIYLKKGDLVTEVDFLVHREKPENKYNWIKVVKQFALNYQNTEPDSDNLWKWGQIVPEDGEYLCRDCGYIEEFKAGTIFPICEVCLAGDPDGPMDLDDGYWEKL